MVKKAATKKPTPHMMPDKAKAMGKMPMMPGMTDEEHKKMMKRGKK